MVERPDFENITEQDVFELIDNRIPEGLRLDYKRKSYGYSDSEKREFLKDVSAFANTNGGHLVLGIDEDNGVALSLVGLEGINTDSEILRLQQLVRSALEPPITGIQFKAIPLKNEKEVILIRVPRSWNVPHRVTAQNSNRFYVRHSSGVHEPTVEELRTLFSQSSTAVEKAKIFKKERIESVCNNIFSRPLYGDGRFFLHIMPVSALLGENSVDLIKAKQDVGNFLPLGVAHGATNSRFNFEGFRFERPGENLNGYTQIFRNGVLEATKGRVVTVEEGYGRHISAQVLERQIVNSLPKYIAGLRDLGVPPPFIISLSFEGVRGAKYIVNTWNEGGIFEQDILFLPDCILTEYSSEDACVRAIRPALDTLWNCIGFPQDQYFNEHGLWDAKWGGN